MAGCLDAAAGGEGGRTFGPPGMNLLVSRDQDLIERIRAAAASLGGSHQETQALQGQQLTLQGQALEAQGQAIQAVQSGLSLSSQVSPPILQSSPAGASTDTGPGHCASKVVELPAKLVFSGKREELQRWLKDVEDFFELNEVKESKKMKMVKGRLPAYLKEWYEKYKEEHGVFSNWESLKTKLTERLKVTMERSIAQAKLQALRCTEALGVEKYNEAFSQLVGQLPHLWEEDVVEDYIKGLPNSIALDVAKVKTHKLHSGGGDTETRVLGAEGVVVVESVEVAVTVDDLESGRSTGAMKREKCPQHMVSMARRAIRKGAVCHILRLQTRSSPSEFDACRVQGLHEIHEGEKNVEMKEKGKGGSETVNDFLFSLPADHPVFSSSDLSEVREFLQKPSVSVNVKRIMAKNATLVPDSLSGLSPSRGEGLDFKIDLEPGHPPSVRPPYRLSLDACEKTSTLAAVLMQKDPQRQIISEHYDTMMGGHLGAGQGKLAVAFCSGLRRKAQGRDRPGEGIVGAGQRDSSPLL
uniref:Retrotransposon gag domain-containing protein n=1 Tax=Chromera velia CCMP2878 TaxID=1169474 RepID=A0A0G4ICD3_9ALVE|eukprot:Cvel_12986.t1-p1 / transcript=Cvel_12986.t1 / gene=Cvel_12986 / organism=Chromera_velia_CCMP2878 / gene_product=hypothetical protein / transcript_product=hypothetical protein / location=Cvel_scaffold870:40861-49914(+) / protein_length=525 / sequence_SO=supercontig / SO=protein_coding / is_pseudo=false